MSSNFEIHQSDITPVTYNLLYSCLEGKGVVIQACSEVSVLEVDFRIFVTDNVLYCVVRKKFPYSELRRDEKTNGHKNAKSLRYVIQNMEKQILQNYIKISEEIKKKSFVLLTFRFGATRGLIWD
ncbi:hypothetical protein AVEN_14029-1 [Araneus ventricosus]|uniref:Uncharacterized protein n=1 Tax=Araneus ventricosus TaxID=182803 RepID=A0A4Y2PAC6_ARAVE|nr:hypothetical protein AVEN_14029-1 [Araneus ventricosus]